MTGSGKTAAFVPADPAPADRQAAGHHARPDPDPHPRAGRADPGRHRRPGRAHAGHHRRRLRRRGHGAAGARPAQRRRRHRGHPRAACSTTSAALRGARAASRCWCSTRPTGCSTWASCPTSAACCGTCRPRRQTLFFSATMPAAIVDLSQRDAARPGDDQPRAHVRRRPSASPRPSIPCAQRLKAALLLALLRRGDMQEALVFTRTKHRANRLADCWCARASSADRIHGNRSQSQRTAGARRLQGRPLPRAGGHRHRRPRHRRGGAGPRGELRRAHGRRRTTSTGSAARRAPRRRARPSPSWPPKRKARCATSSARSASGCRG